MPDPLHELQASARRCARHVLPGAAPRRVVVLDERGQKLVDVQIPPTDPPEITLPPEVRPGWDFTRAVPRFDGADVPIAGRPLDVLRLLARSDAPLTVSDLRKAWGGYDVGDSGVRFAVGKLREKLAEQFPTWEGEIIESGAAGYALNLR